ncbi:MAG: O-antigen ligase family protein [Pseudolabrys sp.]
MAGFSKGFTQEKFTSIADGLVVALAVSLPWSTSATSILAVFWLLALIPTLRWADIRREVSALAGGLPVLLVVLGVVGMLWADVTLLERWKGLDSFLKLLAIPLLFAQFRRSGNSEWVFVGYLVSCVALLVATAIVMVTPLAPTLINELDGNVLVKNAPTQAGEFVTCIFGLMFLAHEAAERRRWVWLFGCAAIISAMLANTIYLSTSRTVLVVALILLVLFAIKRLKAKGTAVAFASAIVIGVVAWTTSPYLRGRTEAIQTELQKYEATNARTSSGERVEFWRKSIEFVRQSPVFGHGTGSIHALFEKSAVGQTGAAGVASTNPHNQTLAVAIQLGLVGVAVLWAMWIAHLLLFRGNSFAEWIGLVIVVQNIVGSLFNSHLFDFVQGWVYVVGVGVAGGIMSKVRAIEKRQEQR